MSDTVSPDWFHALLESAPDVYFRYQLAPTRRFDYLSPSVETLTGHAAAAFADDPSLCFGIVARDERRLLRQILRASRGLTLTLHIRKGRQGKTIIPIEVRTVAIVKQRRVVAIEGVARTLEAPLFTHGIDRTAAASSVASSATSSATSSVVSAAALTTSAPEPVQQRLMALLGEVHSLLHRALPPPVDTHVVRIGALTFDLERLVAREQGHVVALTGRETQMLRYLLQHPGRVITRQHILDEVWGRDFEGSDRAVDVHVSRLRKKLPSLKESLVAMKGVGYRLDTDPAVDRAVGF